MKTTKGIKTGIMNNKNIKNSTKDDGIYIGSAAASVNGDTRYEHCMVICIAQSLKEAEQMNMIACKEAFTNHYGHGVTTTRIEDMLDIVGVTSMSFHSKDEVQG